MYTEKYFKLPDVQPCLGFLWLYNMRFFSILLCCQRCLFTCVQIYCYDKSTPHNSEPFNIRIRWHWTIFKDWRLGVAVDVWRSPICVTCDVYGWFYIKQYINKIFCIVTTLNICNRKETVVLIFFRQKFFVNLIVFVCFN